MARSTRFGPSLVLVFAVTRVIFIPQGEFVTYGALTLASLQLANSRDAGCCWARALASPSWTCAGAAPGCGAADPAIVFKNIMSQQRCFGLPGGRTTEASAHTPDSAGACPGGAAGPMTYRLAYQRLPMRRCWCCSSFRLRCTRHDRLGLVFFWRRGVAHGRLLRRAVETGVLHISGQSCG